MHVVLPRWSVTPGETYVPPSWRRTVSEKFAAARKKILLNSKGTKGRGEKEIPDSTNERKTGQLLIATPKSSIKSCFREEAHSKKKSVTSN